MNKKLIFIFINEMLSDGSNILVIFKIDLGPRGFEFTLLPSCSRVTVRTNLNKVNRKTSII